MLHSLYLPLQSVLTLCTFMSSRPQHCDLQQSFYGLIFSLKTEHWQELFLYPQSNSAPISQQTNNLPLNMASLGKLFASRHIRVLYYIPCVTHYIGNFEKKMAKRFMSIYSTQLIKSCCLLLFFTLVPVLRLMGVHSIS